MEVKDEVYACTFWHFDALCGVGTDGVAKCLENLEICEIWQLMLKYQEIDQEIGEAS